eukprot:TRINITY_DN6205_c0_g1_i2.p2 TRINITY_DN6205_c0_g1~~TRINITY_DN6205_c0_g1_i2.p2  ORF type:complete len:130 (+),score=4.13 TRINITY_DN6205_c0_g1_i2:267-656(+)
MRYLAHNYLFATEMHRDFIGISSFAQSQLQQNHIRNNEANPLAEILPSPYLPAAGHTTAKSLSHKNNVHMIKTHYIRKVKTTHSFNTMLLWGTLDDGDLYYDLNEASMNQPSSSVIQKQMKATTQEWNP